MMNELKNFDILLFDLDGTLTDSQEGIINCMKHALTAMGREIPDDMNRFLGPPLYESFDKFSLDHEEASDSHYEFRDEYPALI